jgi:hypothetical protein
MNLARIVRLSVVVALSLVCGCTQKKTLASTMRRFSRIHDAIGQFARDHTNDLPGALSDLVPKYVGETNLWFFYPPDGRSTSAKQPSYNPEQLGALSDCVYLGTSGIPHQILAYERDGAWNHEFGPRRLIIRLGGGVSTVTATELDDLLHKGESAVLERLRKERVTSYEANLQASLNVYRSDHGKYLVGDNASVIRLLFGKEHSYEEVRNQHGEDLDPWGTPYFIESDGTKVRIKSAGGNRKPDQPGATDYDDICFTVIDGSTIGDGTPF